MSITAWHFVGDTLRDGSPIPEDGATLKYDGELRLCVSGLHASIDPFDALQYAPWKQKFKAVLPAIPAESVICPFCGQHDFDALRQLRAHLQEECIIYIETLDRYQR